MKDVLARFDSFLEKRELQFEAIIIGGAALVVMDIISRFTKDVDCLDPNIPEGIKIASVDFAKDTYDEFRLSSDRNFQFRIKKDKDEYYAVSGYISWMIN